MGRWTKKRNAAERKRFEKWWAEMLKSVPYGDSYKKVAWNAWVIALTKEDNE